MRVDFYVLTNSDPNQKLLTACRLIEKAYNNGHRVFVYCDNQTQAHDVDELLWTYKEESFIPHNLQGEGPEPSPAVQIGYDPKLCNYNDILINLSESIPVFFTQFKRTLEIVATDEAAKEISRQHYRYYKQNNLKIVTAEI
jgi:DNA polymerase III subunit chi